MRAIQQVNHDSIFRKATRQERFIAGGVFLAIAGMLVFFNFAGRGYIDFERWTTPCGLKQNYGLPCPTCGFTTATLEFARGEVFGAFYIQPAAAFIWVVLVFISFFALIMGLFGIYFRFLESFRAQFRLRHAIVALIIIILAGWAVTLSRALVG
jgi:hypothetical protein